MQVLISNRTSQPFVSTQGGQNLYIPPGVDGPMPSLKSILTILKTARAQLPPASSFAGGEKEYVRAVAGTYVEVFRLLALRYFVCRKKGHTPERISGEVPYIALSSMVDVLSCSRCGMTLVAIDLNGLHHSRRNIPSC